jgi:hypothetical protein
MWQIWLVAISQQSTLSAFTGALHMPRAALIFLLIALLPSPLRAEARIALLIGNEAYGNEIGRLANPHNDVALLEGALKGLGFEIVTVRQANGKPREARVEGTRSELKVVHTRRESGTH